MPEERTAKSRLDVTILVKEAIRRDVLSGKLPAGDRLTADALARRLGVSHIPVREALRIMEAEGQVVSRHGKGFFVADLSLAELEDIYEWREIVEAQGVSKGFALMADQDVSRARELLDAMTAVETKSDRTEFVELNRQFHLLPLQCAESPTLLRFIEHLWDAAARYQAAVPFDGHAIPVLNSEHRELVAAMEERDATRYLNVMRVHRRQTWEPIRQGLITGESSSAGHTHS